MTRRRLAVVVAAASCALTLAGTAVAATGWNVGLVDGSNGNAQGKGFAPPTGGTATPTSSTSMTLSWAAPAAGATPDGYTVLRCSGTTCTPTAAIPGPSTCSGAITALTCSDTGLTASTTYRYAIVGGLGRNWATQSTIFSGTTSAAVTNPTITSPSSFSVASLKPNTAGQTVSVAGTNFQVGVTVSVSDSNYVVRGVVRNSSTSLTVTIDDTYKNSGTNTANLTVTNLDGGAATSVGAINNKG